MPSLWELLCVSRQKYRSHHDGPVKPHSAGDQVAGHKPDLAPPDPSGHRRRFWSESEQGTALAFGNPDNHLQPRPTYYSLAEDDRSSEGLLQERSSARERAVTSGTSHSVDSWEQSFTGTSTSQTSAPHEHAKRNYDDEEEEEQEARNRKEGRRRHVQDIFNEGGYARRRGGRSAAAGKAGAPSETKGRRGKDSTDDTVTSSARQSFAPKLTGDSSDRQSTSKTAPPVSKPRRSPNQSHPYNDDNNNMESATRNKKGIMTDNMAHYEPRSVITRDASEVLFGHRLDDFVHNPDWNRNMDRFAASPSAGTDPAGHFRAPPPSTTGHSSVSRQRAPTQQSSPRTSRSSGSSAELCDRNISVVRETGPTEPRGQISMVSTARTPQDCLGSYAPTGDKGSSSPAGINCNYASPSDRGAPCTDCHSGVARNQQSNPAGAVTACKHKKAYYVDDCVARQGLRRNSQASYSHGSGLDERDNGTNHEEDVLY